MSETKFSIEAIVSCDERGQLVLPKEIRKRLGITSGDKMALLHCAGENEEFVLTLIKTNSLDDLIKTYLSPVLKEIVK